MNTKKKIGVQYVREGKSECRIWAPELDRLALRVVSPIPSLIPLTKDRDGYFYTTLPDIQPNDTYFYRINDNVELPDPFSYFQPDGIFGPSCVVDHESFVWTDTKWKGLSLDEMIIYELHVGAFTPEGTFDGVRSKLPYLKELGISAIEIMPVSQFPGSRDWGYDGVFPFAVQNSYGGPDGLKKLIDECHRYGISVILDVVYNHLGPEGNSLPVFVPCFNSLYKTPWGEAINFDNAYSYGVRNIFIQNALDWFEKYHIDALRIDAIQGIFDRSAKHFLKELAENVEAFSKKVGWQHYLIAESDLNDVRTILPWEKGGYGIHAQWNDDFHHSLHAILTNETNGYYEDFGSLTQLAKAIQEGFVYSWEYSSFRKRYHGSSSSEISPSQFVIFSQNHDQVGNRLMGERLSTLVSFEALKIAVALVMFSRNIPLLFMGEEYGEIAPFLYFVDFHDEQLVQSIRKERAQECEVAQYSGELCDPFNRETFQKSKLQWNVQESLLAFYKRVIKRRNECGALTHPELFEVKIYEQSILCIRGQKTNESVYLLANFDRDKEHTFSVECQGEWRKILDSSDKEWGGSGSNAPAVLNRNIPISLNPLNVVLYKKKT